MSAAGPLAAPARGRRGEEAAGKPDQMSPTRAAVPYKSFIWWKLKGTKTASNRGVASLQQKNAQFKCVSSEKSGWGSTTAGTIVYRGKTYYARVYPARVSLSCGG